MKKLLLLLMVCITLTSCSSAGTKTDSSISVAENSADKTISETGASEAKSLQLTDYYKSEKITLPDNLMYINELTTFNNSDNIIVYGIDEEHNNLYYKTDKTFSEYTPFEYSYPEESENYDTVYGSPCFNPDGSFNTIVNLENHNGITLEKVENGEYTYEDYYNNCVTSYMFCTYDKDGNILKKALFEYPESFYSEDNYLFFKANIADGDSFILIDNNNIFWRLSSDGKFTQMFTYESEADDNYYSLIRDRDGKIICMIESMTLDGDYYKTTRNFYEFTDAGLSEKPLFELSEDSELYNISVGYGEYRLFISMYDALYGLTNDGNLEPLVNWINSSIQPMNTYSISENEYISISDTKLLRLTPRDMSEFADTKIITFASPMINDSFKSNNTMDIINDFNNSQTDYRINTVATEGKTNADGFYSAENALNMLFLTGEAPDIIYGLKYDSFVNYRKKGVFTDMYSLIENDSELNKDDFLPNVISALESPDGNLFGLCESFGVATLYTKTSVWDKENWTLDEFIEAHDNAPDSFSHLYDGMTKIEILNQMTYAMNDFIDYENVVCHFDSPDFIRILEFCNRFVDEVPKPSKTDEPEAFSNYHAEKYKWLGNEQIIYEKGDAGLYNNIKYLQANSEDITFAGYPSSDGKGGLIIPNNFLCISESCENKQGAWEFVKFYINNHKYGVSVLKDSFEDEMDAEMTRKSTANGIEIPSFDQQTRDKVAEYMKSCTKLGSMYDYPDYCAFDNDIMSIMKEEAELYFNGEQTVETASENIQKRVSVVISERS